LLALGPLRTLCSLRPLGLAFLAALARLRLGVAAVLAASIGLGRCRQGHRRDAGNQQNLARHCCPPRSIKKFEYSTN